MGPRIETSETAIREAEDTNNDSLKDYILFQEKKSFKLKLHDNS